MDDLANTFVNPYVIAYLVIIIGVQVLYAWWQQSKRRRIARQRRVQGLSDDIIMDHAEQLVERKRHALVESTLFLLTLVIVPFAPIGLTRYFDSSRSAQNGIAIVFVGLLLWVLINATDVAKAFLGGLAFKTLSAFKRPFQVGGRVTLKDIGGKVIGFDTFFVTLQTLNDDQISIPTASLWSEVLSSTNAGERSSLCVINFYLAPFVEADQCQAAEDTIWDAIQASAYFEPAKPLQIFLSQNPDSIQLTAKAYVASTYNEPLLTSDVTRAFLTFASKQGIALASPAWRASVDKPNPRAARVA